jgi:dipeptidyl aminopeptidase/acylaminoacyl peptidase
MWAAEVDAKNADIAPDIKEARELAFKSSPVASIANWRSPVLFVHGDDDRNVPFQQTTDLVEKLRGQNVAFEELIIPDEIHDVLRWNDWVRAYRATSDFFDRKLTASGGTRTQNLALGSEVRDWYLLSPKGARSMQASGVAPSALAE